MSTCPLSRRHQRAKDDVAGSSATPARMVLLSPATDTTAHPGLVSGEGRAGARRHRPRGGGPP